ncbi:aldehyde dehydrogenase (NADP(+)) [Altererythrobacter sp. FM1]|uniref:aldehyde dehydrogenase (NADP(+)) n=1 Tax=Tsuneonella flava TaxID=2055955 RepID=UPI000C7F82AC|nr:aldehyde dehydrogenase (NADP(+)) [Tsuneonella flava]ROT96892.1 aldehyde dehydrogenase (NADP(+)) [Altererythrobacter sp. FM1]
MTLTGKLFIAGERRDSENRFHAFDPSTDEAIPEPAFAIAGPRDIDDACAAAEAAFAVYSSLSLEMRAQFLEAVAEEIDALGEALTKRAHSETGLPEARLNGERGRTVGQLRLFAQVVRDGAWQGIRIDSADPARTPPKPDLRLHKIPLGPVAVFGASNFPLAFSIAGGDTASALAAGCPVVAKGHPAHPGTSELVASAIMRAVERTRLPQGVFSLLNGTSHELGTALVSNHRIQAVGFTGSRMGGEALMKVAASRKQPIPVYAEMSAINPVILLPAALASRGDTLAQDYAGSVTMGAGQFCTNPGLILAVRGEALDNFVAGVAEAIRQAAPQVMLTQGIREQFGKGKTNLTDSDSVALIGEGAPTTNDRLARAAIFRTSAAEFVKNPLLREENFGASSVIIECDDIDQLLGLLAEIEGQLTATLHMAEDDFAMAGEILSVLERKAGRIIANGWPTGVEVSHAMVHGGPYPATSEPKSTSVGTLAIDRFLRPICYQDFPSELLPTQLIGAGQEGTIRMIDGIWTM